MKVWTDWRSRLTWSEGLGGEGGVKLWEVKLDARRRESSGRVVLAPAANGTWVHFGERYEGGWECSRAGNECIRARECKVEVQKKGRIRHWMQTGPGWRRDGDPCEQIYSRFSGNGDGVTALLQNINGVFYRAWRHASRTRPPTAPGRTCHASVSKATMLSPHHVPPLFRRRPITRPAACTHTIDGQCLSYKSSLICKASYPPPIISKSDTSSTEGDVLKAESNPYST